MARSLVRSTLAALALVLAACGGESPLSSTLHLEITPDREAYTAGSTATLTIRNLGASEVSYSLCGHEIQRQTPTGWVAAVPGNGGCALVIFTLAPGASVTAETPLPASLPAGTYRVYLPGFVYSRPDEVSLDLQTRKSSRPFQVTAP